MITLKAGPVEPAAVCSGCLRPSALPVVYLRVAVVYLRVAGLDRRPGGELAEIGAEQGLEASESELIVELSLDEIHLSLTQGDLRRL